jgi:hypothetical protein
MAVSEPEKNADIKSRPPSILKSSQRGVSSKGGKTSFSYLAGHVEEVLGNWQPLLCVSLVVRNSFEKAVSSG